MSQPVTETTAMPTTWTLITPTQDDTAQVVTEDTTLTALEERQNLLAHHVRLVARGMSTGLFVYGSQGGLGKSRTVLRTLADEGVSPVLVNSSYHAARLVRHPLSQSVGAGDLLRRRGQHLWLYVAPRLAAVGSLGRSQGRHLRVVANLMTSLARSSSRADLIFCGNVIPAETTLSRRFSARCDIFQLDATQEEVVDLMRSVASAGYETLTPDDCHGGRDFIEQNGDDRAISLRLLEPSFRKVIYARSEGLDWRPLVMTQLKTLGRKEDTSRRLDAKAQEIRTLHQAIERFPDSVAEQQVFWSWVTGKSRASFFRLLAKHRPK